MALRACRATLLSRALTFFFHSSCRIRYFFLWNDLHSYFNKNFEIKGGICYWSSRNLWNWQQEISRKKGMKICQKKFCYACQCLTHNQPDNVTKHPITNWLISWRVIDSWHIIIAFIMTLFLMRFSHLLRHGVK